MLTVQEALKNLAVVSYGAILTGAEHDALKESVTLVSQRCKVADELEKANKEAEATKKDEKSDQGS